MSDINATAAHVRWKDGAYRCSFCSWSRDGSPGWSREPFAHILDVHPEWTTTEAIVRMDAARARAVARRLAKKTA